MSEQHLQALKLYDVHENYALPCNFMREAQSIQETVAETLERLIPDRQVAETAKAAKVSLRALHKYIRLEGFPRVDKLEQIARNAFGMALWQLLVPGIPAGANYAELARLVRNWINASASGRSYLAEVSDQVAINTNPIQPPPGAENDALSG